MGNPMRRSIALDFGIPLLVLVVLTLMFRVTDLDLTIEHFFYVPGAGWVYNDLAVCSLLYRYGTVPAFVLFCSSIVVLAVSFWNKNASPYRIKALFFVLLMVLGPGLVVNVVFKDYWGRPRPRQVEDLGGKERPLKVLVKGEAGKGKSFPSGHASMGFYLFAPYFVFRRSSRKLAGAFLLTGLSCGLLMGVVRMAQGGHFASDVVWAGGFVYLCGLALYYLLGLNRTPVEQTGDGSAGAGEELSENIMASSASTSVPGTCCIGVAPPALWKA